MSIIHARSMSIANIFKRTRTVFIGMGILYEANYGFIAQKSANE